MSDGQDLHSENRREFSRVEAHIPLEIRFVPPEERQRLTSRIEDDIVLDRPPDVNDPVLSEWLKLVNNKLDILLGQMAIKQQNTDTMAGMSEDISGGGLSFIAEKEYAPGDVFEVRMKLPAKWSQVLCMYGEVVQSSKRESGYFTAVRFIMFNNATRDRIIKLVFEREREILRERRGDG